MTISGFIAYAIQTWKNKPDTSTPLSAARLAHIEAGIKANSDAITKLAAAVINQQANDVNKIPSSALMYSVNEKVDSAISDLAKAVYSSNLMAPSDGPVFLRWDVDTLNTPFKAGLTYNTAGFAFVYGDYSNYQTVVAFVQGQSYFFIHSVDSGNVHGWKKFPAN